MSFGSPSVAEYEFASNRATDGSNNDGLEDSLPQSRPGGSLITRRFRLSTRSKPLTLENLELHNKQQESAPVEDEAGKRERLKRVLSELGVMCPKYILAKLVSQVSGRLPMDRLLLDPAYSLSVLTRPPLNRRG
ncbi:MAG: hypothetical protein MMC23_003519 [Stictis urceolatum]|nr:hypothetical protein [Stictis urceolata]